MYSSKWKMFGQLYRKDMHQVLPELIIVIGISVILDLLMYFNSEMGRATVAIVPMFMTLGLAAFLPLVSSFKTIGQEWNNNTIYMLKSLPVSGAMVMGSKVFALISQFVLGILVVGVGEALVTYHTLPQNIKIMPQLTSTLSNPANYKWVAIILLMIFVTMLYLFANSFFSQMIGRLSPKLSGLITGVVFITVMWLVGKITGYFGRYLESAFLIDGHSMSFQTGLNSAAVTQTGLYGAAIFCATYLLVAAILFICTTFIYDRYLGV